VTGPEHYAEAERLLRELSKSWGTEVGCRDHRLGPGAARHAPRLTQLVESVTLLTQHIDVQYMCFMQLFAMSVTGP
jgi:hypothetical protein